MTVKAITATILVGLTAAFLPVSPDHSEEPAQAQATDPTWTPIARINPQKPYRIQLVNQTANYVEFASTTNEFPPRKLQAGASTSLAQLPVPIYLLISSVNSAYDVRYVVSAQQNVITVRIQPLPVGRLGQGHTTLNVQETGGVYVY